MASHGAGKRPLRHVLVISAQGDPNAFFVFKTASTLPTAADSSVLVVSSGRDCNVFWQIGSSTTLDTGAGLAGNILALISITRNGDGSLTRGWLAIPPHRRGPSWKKLASRL